MNMRTITACHELLAPVRGLLVKFTILGSLNSICLDGLSRLESKVGVDPRHASFASGWFKKGGIDASRIRIRGIVGTYDLRLTHDDGRLEGTQRNADR